MTMSAPVSLDLRQVQAIVRGMYRVAQADGAHERELVLMRGFYESCRAEVSGLADFAEVVARDLDPAEARAVISTPELREAFFRSCYLVAWADGRLSTEERAVLDALADVVGVERASLAAIAESVMDQLVGTIARAPDASSIAKLRSSMK